MAALRVAFGSPRRAIPRTMSATSTAAAAAASARGTRPGASCSVRGAGRAARRSARLNCEKNPFFMARSGTAKKDRCLYRRLYIQTRPAASRRYTGSTSLTEPFMKPTNFGATLLVLALPFVAGAGTTVDIEVLDRRTGRILPVYWHDGDRHVAGEPGR